MAVFAIIYPFLYVRNYMGSQRDKELMEAYEALLWGSRQLSIKTKAEARALAQKIKKLDEEGDVELSKIKEMANHLRRELASMLEASQNLSDRPGEKFFQRPVPKNEKTRLKAIYQKQLTLIIVTIVSIIVVSSLGASAYLLYTRIVMPLGISGTSITIWYLPLITLVGIVFGIFYIFQSVSAFSSLIRYRRLHEERIELGTALHSTESILAKLLDFSSHERDRSSETTEQASSKDEHRVLWRQYDAALVDFLYGKRKPT